MGYEESYKQAVVGYNNLIALYNEKVTQENFQQVARSLPFDFLEAKHKAEMLTLYKQLGEKGQMHFRSAEEAAALYSSLGEIKKGIGSLLNGASIIVEAEKIKQKINEMVSESPYLPGDLALEEDDVIYPLAQDCLKTLPTYPQLVTKKFRSAFIEGCVQSLTPDGIVKLAQLGVVKKQDLEILEQAGIYTEKLAPLASYFGYKVIYKVTKVRGTSYSNENGVKRQDVLKKIIDEKGSKGIILEKSKWTPEGSTEEKNAVGVYYDGDQAGFVGQDVVDEMYAAFEEPEFSAKFSKGLGGKDGLNYGLEISLHTYGQEKAKSADAPQAEK